MTRADEPGAVARAHYQPRSARSARQRGARERRNATLDLGRIAHIQRADLDAKRHRGGLDRAKLAQPGGHAGIPKNGHPRHARGDLLEQLQPLPGRAVFGGHEAGDVTARARQTVGVAGRDRIAGDGEDDRYRPGRLLHRRYRRAAMRQDDVRRERGQFRRVLADGGGVASGPANIDPYVAADGPAQLCQRLQERAVEGLKFRIVRRGRQDHADASHPLALLCARGKRPRNRTRRRAAKGRDERAPQHMSRGTLSPFPSPLWGRVRGGGRLHGDVVAIRSTPLPNPPPQGGREPTEYAALHSITSSARASSVCGTVRPSALAVLRLMTSSNLVGACTGRSAGFSPLRTRST